MANSEIDSLSLDISITGLDDEKIKQLDKLSKAVARLTKSLKDADFSKLKEIKLPKGVSNLQIINQNFKEASESVSNAISNIPTGNDTLGQRLEEEAKDIDDASLKVEGGSKRFSASAKQIKDAMKKAQEALEGKKNKKSFLEKQINKLEKIFKRFKTIAFIKAVRAILNSMVNAVKNGATNLAKYDSNFQKTMDGLKTNALQMVNSIILIARPFIEFLQPFIQALANGLIQISNAVSKVTAVMKGASKYTKVNADYMEKFANASQKASLFSFDTFTSLSGDATSDMYTEEIIEDEDITKASDLYQMFLELKGVFEEIFNLLGTIFAEIKQLLTYISPILNKLLSFIRKVLEKVNVILGKIFEALNPIIELLMNDVIEPLLDLLVNILSPILDLIVEILDPITDIIKVLTDVLKPILNVIKEIINYFKTTLGWLFDFISKFIGSELSQLIANLLDNLKPIISIITTVFELLGDIWGLVNDIFNADFEGLVKRLVNLVKKLFLGLIKIIVNSLESIVNFFIDAVNLVLKPIDWIAGLFGGNVEIPHVNFDWMIPNFATGGIVGELWQMNEYGKPEMLYNSSGNNDTAVITQAQLSLAFEEAIYNTGLLETIKKAGNINIDGKSIAQSQSFKNELNRTNPNLNIR